MRSYTSLSLRAAAVAVLPLWCAGVVLAQTATGINGTVTDKSGATVGGCQVEVKNDATGVVSRATTSSAGTFNFPNLLPGTYTVTFSHSGFSTQIESGVTVETGKTAGVNESLAAGTVDTTGQGDELRDLAADRVAADGRDD